MIAWHASGAAALDLRLRRHRGATPSLVSEEEVLHILAGCLKGPVECVPKLGADQRGLDKIRLAAVLTSLAHLSHGEVDDVAISQPVSRSSEPILFDQLSLRSTL